MGSVLFNAGNVIKFTKSQRNIETNPIAESVKSAKIT